MAAPYAAMVMDARTGQVYHERNADTRLHPASLTKMMTLYIAFQAIQRGQIGLDTEVTITASAANEPPSKLGLRAGQRIRLRYLLRAAAVKSANDAATAIGIAIAGSEAGFARQMNATARAMGMNSTNFINMHGLTEQGHLSTARDMTILGRHMIYDFPQYYNLFSRRTADAGIAQVSHTNRRFLDSYSGADGIKTGYTRAAGFNLVASAERGQERIIVTVFGGASTADRNARVTELMDLGFAQAPATATLRRPTPPPYTAPGAAPAAPSQPVVLASSAMAQPGAAGKTIRVTGQVVRSLRPQVRPAPAAEPDLVMVSADIIESAVAAAIEVAAAPVAEPILADPAALGGTGIAAFTATPVPRPTAETVAVASAGSVAARDSNADAVALALAAAAMPSVAGNGTSPRARPADLVMAAAVASPEAPLPAAAPAPAPAASAPQVSPADTAEPEVVTRISTSSGRHWGINVGRFSSNHEAERVLIQVALSESTTLDGSLRRVQRSPQGFEATFQGLSRDGADLACRRLQARGTTCFMIGPPG